MRSSHSLPRIVKRIFPAICIINLAMPAVPDLRAALSPPGGEEAAAIIQKMEASYARVGGYEAEVEDREYQHGQIKEETRFRYTFKKPDHIRIDMESPHPGSVLIYPDETGKVTVKPGGWAGFLKLHLAPDSMILRAGSGQRIDQTDMGLLIKNIVHSLTDRRHGEIRFSDQDSRVLIEVLSEDHFHAGVLTLYHFYIDRTLWLPVEIEESTPDGVLKRKVIFRGLKTSTDFPDNYFRIDGGNAGHSQHAR